jgi:hypothetical protein
MKFSKDMFKVNAEGRRRLLASFVGGLVQGMVLTLLNKYAEKKARQ